MRTQIYSGPELSRTGLSFGGVVDFGGNAGFPEDAALPIVKYLRIFSRRFCPSPRIDSKSSTLLNAPYDLRICRIFSAVAGPIPGTCCNSSDVAVLMFTGLAGGFFLASSELQNSRKHERRKKPITARGCRAIADA